MSASQRHTPDQHDSPAHHQDKPRAGNQQVEQGHLTPPSIEDDPARVQPLDNCNRSLAAGLFKDTTHCLPNGLRVTNVSHPFHDNPNRTEAQHDHGS